MPGFSMDELLEHEMSEANSEISAGPLLIVGLGNPGRDFKLNRHNVGFMLLDRLAEAMDRPFRRRKMEALIIDGSLERRRVILAKPQTFVNMSGRAVRLLLRYYALPRSALLVVLDDLDLPFGMLRIRACGGSGGHNGLKSIQENLGSQDYPRMRIGIGRPPGHMSAADYVLQDFSKEQRDRLDTVLVQGLDCIRLFLREGIEAAMTRCNGNPE